MARILITGVTGFVGSNLVRYFNGFDDYALFGHSREVEKAKQQFKFDKIEIVKEYSSSLLNELKIDFVIHLAGIAHDLSNRYGPEDYYQINYEGTRSALDFFLQSRARKFIFVSSIKAARDISQSPAGEEVVPDPKTDYGKSKLKAEEYILSKSPREDKQLYILRPGMMHGPGNKGNLNLLYRFAKSGLPFPFGAFHNQRSFHSIENFVYVVHTILNRTIPSGVYHLADEGFLSTTELYQLICRTRGSKPHVLNIDRKWIERLATVTRKKDVVSKLTEDMMISNEKLQKTIGQLPIGLSEGLRKTILSFERKVK